MLRQGISAGFLSVFRELPVWCKAAAEYWARSPLSRLLSRLVSVQADPVSRRYTGSAFAEFADAQ